MKIAKIMGVVTFFVIAILLCTLTSDSIVILPQLLVNALISGSIYALASSGLSLTYGLLRILNFAHGHFMMVGAYTCLFFTTTIGVNFGFTSQMGAGEDPTFIEAVISMVAELIPLVFLTWLFMIVFSALALRIFILPFTKYSYFLSFVTTLALSIILESLISMFFGVNVKTLLSNIQILSVEWGGIYITPIQLIIIISALVMLSLVALIIHISPVGRKVRALSEHSAAGESLGISKRRVSYLVFIGGSLLAAYAGIMIGYESSLQPTMGSSYTIKAFAAMVLGGLGNMWGTVIGAYLLGLIENMSIGILNIPAGYKDAFAFVIILVVLLFRPQGLFNRAQRQA